METIEVSVKARVKNGPSIGFSRTLEVDAYDRLQVTVIAGAGATIQLIPVATSAVQCLFIESSIYDTSLTYSVNGAGTNIALDSPQNFVGEGAVSALDSVAPPATLNFTNGLADDVLLKVLVGRSAVA